MRKQIIETQSTPKKPYAPRSLSLRELQQIHGGDDWEAPRAIIAPPIIQKIG
ncbi:MAG TPA: hypothetical protein VNO30_29870 [Kofleriaceae bacterium]|nr:hypothetical protein [Kofleriaceae bacterium]